MDIFFDIDFIKIPLPLMLKAFLDDNYSIFYDIMKRNFLFTPIDPFKKGFANILPQIFKNQKDTDKTLSKLRSSVNCLTNDQMEFILTFRNDKNINLDFFLYELIKRKYVERPEKTEEQKKILVEINGLLDKMKFKFQFFKRELLLSLLNVDATLNHYDLKLFLEYLECPVSNSTDMYKITDDMKKQIQANASCRTFVSSNIDYIASDAEKKLITKYLFHFFFFDNLSIDKFTNYFNLDFLNKIYYKAKVLKGSEEKIGDQLTSGELSELIKQVKLEICDFNKKKFEVNESIELILNVKNIGPKSFDMKNLTSQKGKDIMMRDMKSLHLITQRALTTNNAKMNSVDSFDDERRSFLNFRNINMKKELYIDDNSDLDQLMCNIFTK